MPINTWPRGERPREKLISQGAGVLSDAELLALLLGSGSQGKSAVDLARDLLNEFGGLGQLLAADLERLCAVKGLGPGQGLSAISCIGVGSTAVNGGYATRHITN